MRKNWMQWFEEAKLGKSDDECYYRKNLEACTGGNLEWF